jgi:hypothetical protein
LFAVLTLTVIPKVAEELADKASIYDVAPKFNVILWQVRVRLKSVCFPQHILFMIGILLYVLGDVN